MKAVIQRVTDASVTVDGKVVGEIGNGFMILLGVCEGDTEKDAEILAEKTSKLRIFTDENEKMNLSLIDIDGECLVVSQFTLCADVRKGNRPSFSGSIAPDEANRLYEYFMQKLKDFGIRKVEHGIFAADMDVKLTNNGPVTILYDSLTWRR
ncbi:MAG TPA: D-tyrosyl-tRNA(Tyr) deacylase [Clostridiales bacterium]|nr:D-tyrosyl-tRNA(Tyr) deacylase [Clostridiales bacterium]